MNIVYGAKTEDVEMKSSSEAATAEEVLRESWKSDMAKSLLTLCLSQNKSFGV